MLNSVHIHYKVSSEMSASRKVSNLSAFYHIHADIFLHVEDILYFVLPRGNPARWWKGTSRLEN